MESYEHPSDKLRDFLRSARVTQGDFATKVGTQQSVISRILTDKIRPSLDLAFEIQQATDGAVQASSWARTKEEAST